MFLVQSDIYQFLIEMGKKVSRKSLQYQIVFSFWDFKFVIFCQL